MDKDRLQDMSDYELCALFCDYWEWLESPVTGPSDQQVIHKYREMCGDILDEIAERRR